MLTVASSFAGTTTVVTCSNPSTDLDVEMTKSSLTISIYDSAGRGKTLNAMMKKNAKENLTVVGISKKIGSHGVVGEGVLLSVNGNLGYLSSNGIVESLNCDFEPGT